MKKRLFTIALALMLALCFGGTALAASPADQVVEEANLKLLAAESYAMDMELVMEMSFAGETMKVDADYTAKVLTDPDKLKMDIVAIAQTEGVGQLVEMALYAVEEEDSFCVAMNVFDEWQHIDIPLEDYEALLEGDLTGLDTMGSFTGVTGYHKSANATVNGRPAGRYTAKIRWDEYTEMLADLDLGAMAGLSGQEAADFDEAMAAMDLLSEEVYGMPIMAAAGSLFEDAPPTEVHLYIDDETGLPIRYEADLTETFDQMMVNLFDMILSSIGDDEMEAELDTLSIDRYDLVMKIYDVNKVKDFKLPAGAKH